MFKHVLLIVLPFYHLADLTDYSDSDTFLVIFSTHIKQNTGWFPSHMKF